MIEQWAIDKFNKQINDPDYFDTKYEIAHVKHYGYCECIKYFWMPNRGGFTDLWSPETCDICCATYFEPGFVSSDTWKWHTYKYDENRDDNVVWETVFDVAKHLAANDPMYHHDLEDMDYELLQCCDCCWKRLQQEVT